MLRDTPKKRLRKEVLGGCSAAGKDDFERNGNLVRGSVRIDFETIWLLFTT